MNGNTGMMLTVDGWRLTVNSQQSTVNSELEFTIGRLTDLILVGSKGQLDLFIDRPNRYNWGKLRLQKQHYTIGKTPLHQFKERMQLSARDFNPHTHQSFPILQFFNLKSQI